MKDILQYKDYIGSVHFNADDLVSFEGNNVIDLKHAFEEAVDDYLLLCYLYIQMRTIQS